VSATSNQLCGNLNILDMASARGNRQVIFAQTLDMKKEGIPNFTFDFSDRFTCRNAPRQIRHAG